MHPPPRHGTLSPSEPEPWKGSPSAGPSTQQKGRRPGSGGGLPGPPDTQTTCGGEAKCKQDTAPLWVNVWVTRVVRRRRAWPIFQVPANTTVSREVGGHHLPPGARACSLESDPSTPVPACDWGHVSHTRRPPVVMVFSLPWRAVLSDSWAPCQAILLRVEQRRWLEHAGEGGAQDPVWAGGRPPPGFRCGCVAGGGVSPISLGSSGHRSADRGDTCVLFPAVSMGWPAPRCLWTWFCFLRQQLSASLCPRLRPCMSPGQVATSGSSHRERGSVGGALAGRGRTQAPAPWFICFPSWLQSPQLSREVGGPHSTRGSLSGAEPWLAGPSAPWCPLGPLLQERLCAPSPASHLL